MTAEWRTRVGKAISGLAIYYDQDLARNIPADVDADARLEIYLRVLAGLPAEWIERAGAAWVSRSHFMPKADELLATAKAEIRARGLLALLALEEALQGAGPHRVLQLEDGHAVATVSATWGSWPEAAIAWAHRHAGWAADRERYLEAYEKAVCAGQTRRHLGPLVRAALPAGTAPELMVAPEEARARIRELTTALARR